VSLRVDGLRAPGKKFLAAYLLVACLTLLVYVPLNVLESHLLQKLEETSPWLELLADFLLSGVSLAGIALAIALVLGIGHILLRVFLARFSEPGDIGLLARLIRKILGPTIHGGYMILFEPSNSFGFKKQMWINQSIWGCKAIFGGGSEGAWQVLSCNLDETDDEAVLVVQFRLQRDMTQEGIMAFRFPSGMLRQANGRYVMLNAVSGPAYSSHGRVRISRI
jgi:hypothetical protein